MTSSSRTLLSSLAAGSLFGAGLTISQMVNPNKVASFLDVAGDWDPSLALVMGSALGVTAVLYRFALRRSAPLFEAEFHLPKTSTIDGKLLFGSALFGIGWGLGGLCPGPALAGLSYGLRDSLIFVGSMAAGMLFWDRAGTVAASSVGASERAGAISTSSAARG